MRYNSFGHLGEMIALLGPPPPELLKREDDRVRNTSVAFEDAQGRLCERTSRHFGGPFFDSNGMDPSGIISTNDYLSMH